LLKAAETEHRIGFPRFEHGTAQKLREQSASAPAIVAARRDVA
jgi:hypothetical protein